MEDREREPRRSNGQRWRTWEREGNGVGSGLQLSRPLVDASVLL